MTVTINHLKTFTKAVGACTFLLGSLTVSGCDFFSEASSTSPSANSNDAQDKFLPIPTNPPEVEPVVQATGWNREAIQAFASRLPDQRIFSSLSVANDGQIVATVPKQNEKPYEVVLFDPKTKKVETIAAVEGKYAQCAVADVNDQWVVWSEALDQQFLDWNMHVYDRRTHQDRIVYSSPKDSQGHGYPGVLWAPHLFENEFVFSPTVGPATATGPGFVAKKYNLLTNTFTDLTTSGYNPVLTKDFDMWVGYDSEEQDGELFWNRGKVTKQVTKGVHPKYFSVEGDSYAWSNHLNRQWTIGISENGEQKTLVKSGEADALQFLTMSQRILAWTSYEKTQVYDRKLEKLITLDQKPATTVTTKGHYLYWAIPSGTPEQQQQIAKDSGIVAADMYLVDLDKI